MHFFTSWAYCTLDVAEPPHYNSIKQLWPVWDCLFKTFKLIWFLFFTYIKCIFKLTQDTIGAQNEYERKYLFEKVKKKKKKIMDAFTLDFFTPLTNVLWHPNKSEPNIQIFLMHSFIQLWTDRLAFRDSSLTK